MNEGKIKIGVISDTHLTRPDEKLKNILDEQFRDVSLILHTGDLVDLSVLAVFGDKEVKAVYGNMDYPSVKEKLPEQLIFEIKGFKLGLIHGWGAPWGLERKLLERLGKVDCIVYGHTHKPLNQIIDDVLFFNPGSAVDKRFAASRTIGILEIDKDVSGRIINI
jgi:putative phosphoesterase